MHRRNNTRTGGINKLKKDIRFIETTKKLDEKTVRAAHHRLMKNLIAGLELETQCDTNHREKLKALWKPTKSYWGITPNRIVDIKTDGSLYSDGNIEIITIGDNSSFEEQRDNLWVIEKELIKRGFFTDHQTGQHTTLLLQKNFPNLLIEWE